MVTFLAKFQWFLGFYKSNILVKGEIFQKRNLGELVKFQRMVVFHISKISLTVGISL